jgi:Fe-S cluster biogenesis protein NfuA
MLREKVEGVLSKVRPLLQRDGGDVETPLIKRIIKCARKRKKMVVVTNRYCS